MESIRLGVDIGGTFTDLVLDVRGAQYISKILTTHAAPEEAIVAGVAKAVFGDDDSVDWGGLVADYDRIRDKIEAVVPGFQGFNRRINEPGGFYLGNSARNHDWKTKSGKAQFTVAEIPDLTLPKGQLRLMTVRSHDQYHTTVYGLDDRYRGVYGGREVVFLRANDLARLGLRSGDTVDITSHFPDRQRRVEGFTVVEYDIREGCAAGYFPELNPLVSAASYADRSRTPTSKFIPVTIEKA